MRKLVCALALAAGLNLVAPPASAQADGKYPPSGDNLTVSQSSVTPGDSFTASGGSAAPGATVTFVLRRFSSAVAGNRTGATDGGLARLVAAAIRPQAPSSVSLGVATANANGRFSATLRVPASTAPGVYTVTASRGGEVLALVTSRVAASGGAGDLPFTGGNVLPGLVAGMTLIVSGALLLLSLKRRRSTA
jgi:hypothetical protein